MLPRHFLTCLIVCALGQVVGAGFGLALAVRLFTGPGWPSVALIVVGALLGLAVSLAVLCKVIEIKRVEQAADNDDPPLGIGA